MRSPSSRTRRNSPKVASPRLPRRKAANTRARASTAGPGDVVRIDGKQLPPILAQAGAEAWRHVVEYFTAHIRNPNTRAAYGRAVISFFWWCEAHGRHSLRELRPVDIAAYVEEMAKHRAAPTVAIAPDFAEGWNKRATVHYLMDNLDQSLEDIARTLELEPRHFGALSGRGLVYAKLDDLERALDSFEAAVAVNPQMVGPRTNAEAIRQILKKREI